MKFILLTLFLCSCAYFDAAKPPVYYKVSFKEYEKSSISFEIYQTKSYCPKIKGLDQYHASCMGLDGNNMFLESDNALKHAANEAIKY